MKGNAKSAKPLVLTDWWAANSASPPPPWNHLQSPEKQQILVALLKEQRYVCTYCGRAISAEPHSSHIEHFWPQSKFQHRRFDWPNLFASCGPTGKKNTPKICGDAKGNWAPVNSIDPTDPQCEQKFSFDGNGAISSSTVGGTQADRMVKKLNLGDATLDYERFFIVAKLEEQIRDGEIDKTNVGQEIQLWRTVGSDGKRKAFGHVAARYLEDELLV